MVFSAFWKQLKFQLFVLMNFNKFSIFNTSNESNHNTSTNCILYIIVSTVFTRLIVVTIIFSWHKILSRLIEVDYYSRRTIKF